MRAMPRSNSHRTHSLSIYLAKSEVREINALLKAGVSTTCRAVATSGREIGMLYVRESQQHDPAWYSFVATATDLSGINLANASSGAALFIRAADRWFAVAFGTGRHLLDQSSFEDDFGLIVALNVVD